MKKIFLVRHAKSSWINNSITDYERPLNERGERDAPFMANLLFKKEKNIDIIVTSGANRALSTAKVFQKVYSFNEENIFIDKNIYQSTLEGLFNIIKNIDDTYSKVLFIGHNPGLTLISNYLSGRELFNIPTCGIVELNYKRESWKDVTKKSFDFVSFEFPKKYFPQ